MMATIISLLYNENENIVLVTLDLLSELARGPDLASSIEAHGGTQVITGLLSSPSEAIRQRAALLLSIVSSDKTPEYTQRLSNEINTLFQSEPHDGAQWIEAHNQDVPSIYTVEGQIQTAPSLHSDSSRQNVYNAGPNAYVTQHDIEVPGYGRAGQIIQQDSAHSLPTQTQSQMQQGQQPNEPWFDTDL